MKLIRQPDGITCGPTCVKMVADHIGAARGFPIPVIGDLMGVDAITGTTDVRMKRGLKGLGIAFDYKAPGSIDAMRKDVEAGGTYITRVLVGGMKHWILVAGHKGGLFQVFDPAGAHHHTKGREMSAREIERIWAPRNYEAAHVHLKQVPRAWPTLGIVGEKGRDQALQMCEDEFSKVFPRQGVRDCLADVDFAISRAIWIGDTIAGVYLFSRKSINDYLRGTSSEHKVAHLEGLSALEGEALVVRDEYRGLGYGSMLRALPRRLAGELGIDYVWGQQLKALGNLKDWQKRRDLVAESEILYVTVEEFAARPEARYASAAALRL